MARIHARTKGKSGSKRPVKADLSFVKVKPNEVVKIILDLSKNDTSKSKIGLILRDSYGIPSVKLLCGKSISEILKENKLSKEVPEDISFLVKKYKNLKKHLETNTRDKHNKRGLILIKSKILRLAKYYKNKQILDRKWGFDN